MPSGIAEERYARAKPIVAPISPIPTPAAASRGRPASPRRAARRRRGGKRPPSSARPQQRLRLARHGVPRIALAHDGAARAPIVAASAGSSSSRTIASAYASASRGGTRIPPQSVQHLLDARQPHRDDRAAAARYSPSFAGLAPVRPSSSTRWQRRQMSAAPTYGGEARAVGLEARRAACGRRSVAPPHQLGQACALRAVADDHRGRSPARIPIAARDAGHERLEVDPADERADEQHRRRSDGTSPTARAAAARSTGVNRSASTPTGITSSLPRPDAPVALDHLRRARP